MLSRRGVARHLWLFKCTWKKSEYLVSQSHYSHWSVSPWKVLNGYVRQEAAMLEQHDMGRFHRSRKLAISTAQSWKMSYLLRYSATPRTLLLLFSSLTSLLQPCGFFAETLLQAAHQILPPQFHFSPCMHHHWTHSQSSCLICIAVNLFNLLCPCENVKSMRKELLCLLLSVVFLPFPTGY